MGARVQINGVSREVSAIKAGVSGTVRDISEGFCGVNGAVRRLWGEAYVGPDSFTAEMYMRYEYGMAGEMTKQGNLTFTKIGENRYQASDYTDAYGRLLDVWVTVPTELEDHVDPSFSNTYAMLTNPYSGPWNSSYAAGTIYFIEGQSIQYLSGNEIQFTITLK